MSANHPAPRLPLALAGVLGVIFVFTLTFTPESKLNWLLEVGPGVAGIIALALTYRRFPMSRLIYIAVFLHILVLVYGGFYTYAKAPLGFWVQGLFHQSRNNYDKLGHFVFGFFPVLVMREVFLRVTGLRRGGWLVFILLSSVMGLAAAYELIEWLAAVTLDPAGGDAFLGTQGDPWDSQSDMLWAGIGAVMSLVTMSRLHDRSMKAYRSSALTAPRL